MNIKTTTSRYGDKRTVTDNGHGWFTIEGAARFTRGSAGMFDADGGVLDGNALYIGADYGFGTIKTIMVENSGRDGYFKIRVEVEDDLISEADKNNNDFRIGRI